jgi:hypothetical protein
MGQVTSVARVSACKHNVCASMSDTCAAAPGSQNPAFCL